MLREHALSFKMSTILLWFQNFKIQNTPFILTVHVQITNVPDHWLFHLIDSILKIDPYLHWNTVMRPIVLTLRVWSLTNSSSILHCIAANVTLLNNRDSSGTIRIQSRFGQIPCVAIRSMFGIVCDVGGVPQTNRFVVPVAVPPDCVFATWKLESLIPSYIHSKIFKSMWQVMTPLI